MTPDIHIFRKNALSCLCFASLLCTLITGCVTDPVTGQSRADPKAMAALGAIAGGVGGGLIGNKIGGTQGAALGAALGLAAGGAIGYFVTDYLNAREQQLYNAKLNQQMKATPINSNGSDSWVNQENTKAINTDYSNGIPLKQVSAQMGNQVTLDPQRIASLPPNSSCRVANSKFQMNGQQTSVPSVYCRDAAGDYVKVDGTAA